MVAGPGVAGGVLWSTEEAQKQVRVTSALAVLSLSSLGSETRLSSGDPPDAKTHLTTSTALYIPPALYKTPSSSISPATSIRFFLKSKAF